MSKRRRKGQRDNTVSRRDFLRGLPQLLGRKVEEIGATIGDALPSLSGSSERKPEAPALDLPSHGTPREGVPAVHPWLVVAHAVAERVGRRCPYILLLGGSGEAFRLAFREGDILGGARECPVNTFLAALAISGTAATAAESGTFGASLDEAADEVRDGRTVVLGTGTGPVVLVDVDRRDGAATLVGQGGARRVELSELEADWARGAWTNGPSPFLWVTARKGPAPRSLDDVARVGFETMAMLLAQESTEEEASGLAAWTAWSDAARSGALAGEPARQAFGEMLVAVGVGRLAAGRFLESVGRALPPDVRPRVVAASRAYREIHNPSPTGDIWGTGLLPEVAECVTTDGRADPEKLETEGYRDRVADLLAEVREEEALALDEIQQLPEEWRSLR